ncbi:hypothetical protein PYW08_010489 [Mythimna loreyi]|uniref:Uncharacterized protein n=1 Tax=Mythimna loreyi TaxID=667449 RepID=A0ACC2Q4Y1_9NEOP|nr:hypothetical protein PYW08_010489 [Mythimna loreyi]
MARIAQSEREPFGPSGHPFYISQYLPSGIKMRIIHYPKLIEQEETVATSLKNCSVVMDGQNQLHYMYEKSRIPFVFGCETNKYAEYLKKQFTRFKRANVKCYILFKGGDKDIEKKIKKFQQEFFDFDTNCVFVPPIFSKDATVEVIKAIGIDYAFCVTDTKDECVALALKLECPIISYDIEYCFRRAPYIPSSTMKFDDRTKSIQCRQFKLRNFLQKNSLTEEKTAIFAALTDISVFPLEFFDSLLETWGVSCNPQYVKLRHLIIWLSNHSEQEARDGISTKLTTNEDRSKFWFNYYKILTNMRNVEPGHVTEYLLSSNIPIMKQDPEWFEKGVVCKHVSPVYINLYKWKVIDGSWVIDEKSEDSIFLSIDLIKYAYNLMTNFREGKFKVYQDANRYIEIPTHDPNVCRPVYDCKESVFENGWDEVKQLKLFEHFLTENCINIDALNKLPPDCVVLFTGLIYFALKKELESEDVTKEVYAVILSYVLLSLVFNTETCSKDWREHLKIQRVAAKYFQYDEEEAKRIYNGEIYKKLSELQFCIQHMNYLNTLCGSPYESIQYRKMYNGTLVYNMLCEMRKRDVEDFVNELFQMTPSVLALVKDLFEIYQELFL